MTNEEARKILIENFCVPQISGNSEEDTLFNIKMQTAFNMAIKALELFPFEKYIDGKMECDFEMAEVLEQNPGKWIEDKDDSRKLDKIRFYCSACGHWQTYGKTDFCPKCGARMESEEE